MVYYLGATPVLGYRANFDTVGGAIEKIWPVDETPDGGVGYDGINAVDGSAPNTS